MSLFCKKCGKNLSEIDQVVFCPGCGAKIEQQQQVLNEYSAPNQAVYTPPAAYTPPATYTPPAAYTPPQAVNTPPQAAFTPSPLTSQFPSPPTAYPPQPFARSSKNGIGTGAIVGIALGGIVVVALIVFALLSLNKAKSYEGSPTKLSGSWESILSLSKVDGNSDIINELDPIIGKKLDQTLILSLDKLGNGSAELISNSEEVGDLNDLSASYKDGKLTLKDSDGIFTFEGTVGSKGETLKGKFTFKDADASASGTITAQWTSKQGQEQMTAATTQAPRQTEKPAQDKPKPTPQEEPTPAATQPPADEPDSFTINEYIVGKWISEELGDGTSLVYAFNSNGTCMTITTIVENDGTMNGWETGNWYTEFEAYGMYEIENQMITIDLDMDGEDISRIYDIRVSDEGTMDLTEEYGDGSFEMTMTRIG